MCIFFEGFELAQTSEYKNLDKKLSKDCLLVYERMVAAKVHRLLTGSWAKLGPKNSLDGLHKLIQLSQRVASSCGSQPEELPSLMGFVVKYVYVRMLAGTQDANIGIRTLRPWLTVPLIMYKLLQYMKTAFVYEKPIEQKYLAKFKEPETWFSCGSQPGEDGMVMAPSCKFLGLFRGNCYAGKFDGVMQEIDTQQMKSMSGKSVFEYPKFNMTDVLLMCSKEKLQQQNVSLFPASSQPAQATSGSQPEEAELPPQEPVSEEESEDERTEVDHRNQ